MMGDPGPGYLRSSQTTARSIVLWSNPVSGASNVKLLYLLAIAGARHSIDIQSPYITLDASTTFGNGTDSPVAASRGTGRQIPAASTTVSSRPAERNWKRVGRALFEGVRRTRDAY